jgi:hypothetical protein
MADKDDFFDFWRSIVLVDFPKAKIKYKNESKLMRFLSHFVSLYSPGFMSHVTTVLGNTVYFPSESYVESGYKSATRILAHEYVHFCDRRDALPLGFELKYLFPQILVLFSLFSFLAFVHISFILFLLFLVFLVPGIPALYRTQYELAGFAMNLYFDHRGSPHSPVLEQEASELAGLLTGSWYYWAARDRQLVASMLLDRYERFPETHSAFIKVKAWLKI